MTNDYVAVAFVTVGRYLALARQLCLDDYRTESLLRLVETIDAIDPAGSLAANVGRANRIAPWRRVELIEYH